MELIVAGLVGAAIGAAVIWLTGRRRAGGAGTFRFTDQQRPRPTWPKPPSRDEVERMQLRQDPLLLVDRSPLARAIGVGQSQTGDGVTVECVVIEVRESGGRGLLRTLAPDGRLFGPWPEGAAPMDPVPRLEDDVGTVYTVTMPQWTGGDYTAEMLFRFAPAPPVGARQLVIRAPRTPPFAQPSAVSTDGSWVFEVDLSMR